MSARRRRPGLRSGHVILLAVAALIVLATTVRVLSLVSGRIAGDFFYPYLVLPSRAVDGLSDRSLLLRDKFELAAAVETLSEQNRRLAIENAAQSQLAAENELLRRQLRLSPPANYKFIHGEVLQRDPLYWEEQFVVDRGEADGVLPGAAVLAVLPGAGEARPMLVGMVREVTGHTARVQTLLNSELQISCRYEASGAVGFLNVSSGEAEPDDDLVPVGYLPTQDYLIGNLMVSTGYEQHLPSGIPIGRLADIGRSNTPFNGRLYRTVKLRPLADYNLLKFVVLAVSTSPAKME